MKDISDIEVFKSKVRQSFLATDVNTLKQHFEISGLEKLPDQLKFFLKIIDDRKAIEAIMNLKADENILLMKIPKKKPKYYVLLLLFSGFLGVLPFHTRKYGALHISYLNLPCSRV